MNRKSVPLYVIRVPEIRKNRGFVRLMRAKEATGGGELRAGFEERELLVGTTK
jgi:hypothetical protein